jgi:hypothetical protein
VRQRIFCNLKKTHGGRGAEEDVQMAERRVGGGVRIKGPMQVDVK